MNWKMSLYIALLFLVLSPGVLFSVPSKGPLLKKALVHGVLFAAVFHVTRKAVWRMTEGFATPPACTGLAALNAAKTACVCPTGYFLDSTGLKCTSVTPGSGSSPGGSAGGSAGSAARDACTGSGGSWSISTSKCSGCPSSKKLNATSTMCVAA